jgi:catabolite regulation protein CreA
MVVKSLSNSKQLGRLPEFNMFLTDKAPIGNVDDHRLLAAASISCDGSGISGSTLGADDADASVSCAGVGE